MEAVICPPPQNAGADRGSSTPSLAAALPKTGVPRAFFFAAKGRDVLGCISHPINGLVLVFGVKEMSEVRVLIVGRNRVHENGVVMSVTVL